MRHNVRVDPAALDALLAPWNRGDEPGLVAGVAHPDAGNWKVACGLASLELPVVNTTRTRMRVGSITKMFTSLSAMLLAEEGKLDIDAPLRDTFPELPHWAEAMTLRQCMTHTSGMRCSIDLLLTTGAWSRPAPATALATLARQSGVDVEPGTRWSYNNGAFNLLSLAVERASGQCFEDFLRDRIFLPVGMVDSALKRSDLQLLANSASLHVRRADGSFERGFFGPSIAGEGAIVSTLEDMLLWAKQLREPVVGSAETWRAMTTPALLSNGNPTDYGLGMMLLNHRGVRLWGHSGGVVGGLSMCLTAPDLGLDVVVLANRSDVPVHTLAFDIVDACVEGLASRPEPFEAPAVDGLYYDRADGLILRLGEKEGAQSFALGGSEVPMLRVSETRMTCSYTGLDLVADLEPDGSIRVASRGSIDRFESIETAADPEEAGRIAGLYSCDEVECVAAIRAQEDGVTLRLDGPYGRDLYALELVRPGLWNSKCISEPESGLGATLAFAPEGRGFTLSTPRTRHLPFVRLGNDAPATLAARSLPAGRA